MLLSRSRPDAAAARRLLDDPVVSAQVRAPRPAATYPFDEIGPELVAVPWWGQHEAYEAICRGEIWSVPCSGGVEPRYSPSEALDRNGMIPCHARLGACRGASTS